MGWTGAGTLKGPTGDRGAGTGIPEPLPSALPRTPRTNRVYSYPGQGATTTVALSSSFIYATPLCVQGTCQPVSISFELTTAATTQTMRGAVYQRDPSAPDASNIYVGDLGEITTGLTTTGIKTFPNTPPQLTKGLWFVLLGARTATITVRAITNTVHAGVPGLTEIATFGSGYSKGTGVGAGAWPDPWVPTAVTTNTARIHIAF